MCAVKLKTDVSVSYNQSNLKTLYYLCDQVAPVLGSCWLREFRRSYLMQAGPMGVLSIDLKLPRRRSRFGHIAKNGITGTFPA